MTESEINPGQILTPLEWRNKFETFLINNPAFMAGPYTFSARDARQARERFFPGWHTYMGEIPEKEELKPFYRVEARNHKELILAEFVKPPYVRAEFVIPQSPS
ncbi:MAG: hypothetical protein ACD_30C00092G0012 [uncultured bacterium]|uniref:Uncharacterized protein n=3 Tax=Candidatus Daviesiibacteriota TaxID=1752718 RepID=A0A0G0EX10_9BACT|nr:MAG: hypothetical protein ACD_30C00092G0012 [uncultured bacterium]KKQ10027.1 MAG: hypothetical protein US19_C0009G0029 [Candidatus Daviesbacteria bacterium GW2011_GWB1_36_5]KKQ15915.1 MAG: hypothetical protein US28_C0007G0006 [Candidatus Daviesbacteria bacterium GW2011_GWA1_36_8]OGE30794.1 MAG: hypothetical protein A3C99_00630 [Candidatus Daviesbacteria bacterium RIFCSPHIGHO2_02_FULL_37_9]OGE35186.1 MAG: hypothetical protein A3E66_02015 [Candidatus Daviesbacteria bacterium RIFCSPHIGHO2_12_FU